MATDLATAPRLIPGTDLAITPVGLGVWVLGGLWWGQPVDRDQAVLPIHRAAHAGFNGRRATFLLQSVAQIALWPAR